MPLKLPKVRAAAARFLCDMRSKTACKCKPLFDYTMAADEEAEALSIIDRYSKANLRQFVNSTFTLSSLSDALDKYDSSLAGLNVDGYRRQYSSRSLHSSYSSRGAARDAVGAKIDDSAGVDADNLHVNDGW